MFDTSLRDQSVKAHRLSMEQERKHLLTRVTVVLREACAPSGLAEAYVIGSLTQPGHWDSQSDIDVAIGGCSGAVLEIMRILEEATGRAVDVLDLDRHPQPDAVRSKGIAVHG